jgi:N-acetyl-alpha-D-muramate 1-phosphate uridylyltransferase
MLPVALLAGGLATRLGPIANETPKALLNVAGKPFIHRQLDSLRRQNVQRVVICAGHFGEKVQAAVGGGERFGIKVDYSFDGDRLLGTGGAIKKAVASLGDAFFVLYGDSYLQCSLADVQAAYFASGKPALMTVLRNDDRWDQSNAIVRDDGSIDYDKHSRNRAMTHIDYGLSIYSRQVFDAQQSDRPIDLADIAHDLSAKRQLAGLEMRERFYEIGSLQGLEDAERFFTREAASR